MEGVVVEEELYEECNTYCSTVRQIHNLKSERAGRGELDN